MLPKYLKVKRSIITIILKPFKWINYNNNNKSLFWEHFSMQFEK